MLKKTQNRPTWTVTWPNNPILGPAGWHWSSDDDGEDDGDDGDDNDNEWNDDKGKDDDDDKHLDAIAKGEGKGDDNKDHRDDRQDQGPKPDHHYSHSCHHHRYYNDHHHSHLDISWSSTLGMATADLGSFLSMLS